MTLTTRTALPSNPTITVALPGQARTLTFRSGPYRHLPNLPHVHGINMAAEIPDAAVHRLDVPDFDVPDMTRLLSVLKAVATDPDRTTWYVGCMGGIGRTGLFLSALTILEGVRPRYRLGPFAWGWTSTVTSGDAVEAVREHVHPHAVETPEQREFLRRFALDYAVPLAKAVYKRRPR